MKPLKKGQSVMAKKGVIEERRQMQIKVFTDAGIPNHPWIQVSNTRFDLLQSIEDKELVGKITYAKRESGDGQYVEVDFRLGEIFSYSASDLIVV